MIVKQETKVPWWAVLIASVVMVALPAGVAWGVGQARLNHLEAQMEKVEADNAIHNNHKASAEKDITYMKKEVEKANARLFQIMMALKITPTP